MLLRVGYSREVTEQLEDSKARVKILSRNGDQAARNNASACVLIQANIYC